MYGEFCYLKDCLCSIPSLTLPLPSDSFVLQTDASQIGLGAVLSFQRGDEELPVAFLFEEAPTAGEKVQRHRAGRSSSGGGHSPLQSIPHYTPILGGDRPSGVGISEHSSSQQRSTGKMGYATAAIKLRDSLSARIQEREPLTTGGG